MRIFWPLWCLDPYEDQFEKRDSKKKENIAKNEYQRLRNIGKNLKGGRVKGVRLIEHVCLLRTA